MAKTKINRVAFGVLSAALLFGIVPCLAQTAVFSTSFVANSGGNAGYSYAQTVPNISAGGDHVSVTFNPTVNGVHSASHVSICVQSSGYDCASTPVELTFGGVSGFSIPNGGSALASDFVALTTSPGQTLLVKEDVSSDYMPRNGAGFSGWNSAGAYWNVGTPPSGWNGFSNNYGFSLVQVEYQGPPPPPPAATLTAPGLAGQGRLTLVHGQSRLTADASAAFVDYAPDVGNMVPLIDDVGALHWMPFTSSATDAIGQTLMLDGTWTANTLYDVYEAWNGGTPVLCFGPAWNGNAPVVADALVLGVKVNGSTMDCRTSPTNTISVPANQAKYLGTILISPIAGQVRCDFKGGQSRQCGIWNSDNQIDGVMKVTNPTTTPFVYNDPDGNGSPPPTIPATGDPTLNATLVSGRPGYRPDLFASLNHRYLHQNGSPNTAYVLGVGWNSLSAMCGSAVYWGGFAGDSLGVNGTANYEFYSSDNVIFSGTQHAWCAPPPFQGKSVAYMLGWQTWYSGQQWVDAGDLMMRVGFKY